MLVYFIASIFTHWRGAAAVILSPVLLGSLADSRAKCHIRLGGFPRCRSDILTRSAAQGSSSGGIGVRRCKENKTDCTSLFLLIPFSFALPYSFGRCIPLFSPSVVFFVVGLQFFKSQDFLCSFIL